MNKFKQEKISGTQSPSKNGFNRKNKGLHFNDNSLTIKKLFKNLFYLSINQPNYNTFL
jgi:hypothetical protein